MFGLEAGFGGIVTVAVSVEEGGGTGLAARERYQSLDAIPGASDTGPKQSL